DPCPPRPRQPRLQTIFSADLPRNFPTSLSMRGKHLGRATQCPSVRARDHTFLANDRQELETRRTEENETKKTSGTNN
ncbi:hypothetical protein LTR94_033635, partial [Friedmanniomyces endolithicus]